jgi:hypothetical protein
MSPRAAPKPGTLVARSILWPGHATMSAFTQSFSALRPTDRRKVAWRVEVQRVHA